jgi:hypothetical protein
MHKDNFAIPCRRKKLGSARLGRSDIRPIMTFPAKDILEKPYRNIPAAGLPLNTGISRLNTMHPYGKSDRESAPFHEPNIDGAVSMLFAQEHRVPSLIPRDHQKNRGTGRGSVTMRVIHRALKRRFPDCEGTDILKTGLADCSRNSRNSSSCTIITAGIVTGDSSAMLAC